MSTKECDRLEVLGRVKQKEITLKEASKEFGLEYRQAKRVWKRYKDFGASGLVHKARGRASNNRIAEKTRDQIAQRYQERYGDFGPLLASEKLAAEKLTVHPDTLVSILKERGLYVPFRKRKKHRKHRQRRSCFGSMIQMDGSHHDWFEGRSEKCVLMVLIDDATNRTMSRLYPAEDLASVFDVFGRWCRQHGVPRSVYVDKHSIYRDEKDHARLTQFGRAMKELNVKLICAHSPQAKGRVERANRLFQDRFVKELRLRGIKTMRGGNDLLEMIFLPEINKRFAVNPKRKTDLHGQVPTGRKLEEILCVAEKRAVGQDWCVRWRNRWLQIDATEAALGLAGKKVEVREQADGPLILLYQDRQLNWRQVSERPRAKQPVINNKRWHPGPEHPWAGKEKSVPVLALSP